MGREKAARGADVVGKIRKHRVIASRTTLCKIMARASRLAFTFSNVCSFMPSSCKRALFLSALHMIACCFHITDACISSVHACIVFALRKSVSGSPCGGSDNAFALVVSVMQVLTLRINWIYRPDVYNSQHALIILNHMQGYYLLT